MQFDSQASLVALVPRAMLFDRDAYLEMEARRQPLHDGARLLALLGAALGFAGASATILHWAGSPLVDDVQRVLSRELTRLPALQRLEPGASSLAGAAGSRWLWLLLRWARPAPWAALLQLLTAPLGLFVGWLGFGVATHGLATLLGGRGRLEPVLGCLALAEAPQALCLVPLLPPLGPAGLGIWAWVVAARFQAVRVTHGLEGWRAFWATLLPLLLAVAAGVAWVALLVARVGF